jgi:hypothetical protein
MVGKASTNQFVNKISLSPHLSVLGKKKKKDIA